MRKNIELYASSLVSCYATERNGLYYDFTFFFLTVAKWINSWMIYIDYNETILHGQISYYVKIAFVSEVSYTSTTQRKGKMVSKDFFSKILELGLTTNWRNRQRPREVPR